MKSFETRQTMTYVPKFLVSDLMAMFWSYHKRVVEKKGWWSDKPDDYEYGVKAALIASEAFEVMAELRKPEVDRKRVAEELVDVFLRWGDFVRQYGLWDEFEEALKAKLLELETTDKERRF